MTDAETAALLLRLGIGITMLGFGLYQFSKPESWFVYIPRPVAFIAPVSKTTLMRIHALFNVGLGAWFALGVASHLSEWFILAWWIAVLPMCGRVVHSAALRDFAIIMAIAAFIVLN